MTKNMTYAGSGVDYDQMDPFKRRAVQAGRATATNLVRRWGLFEVMASRGESAYLIELPDRYLAHVEEGLGTKNIVADALYALTERLHYACVAQDTVAMIVNDMVTLGAMPLSLMMHLAVGNSAWFRDEARAMDLIAGWQRAADLAQCSWGGGETPTLTGIVDPETVVLAGSATGHIFPKSNLIRGDIQIGDAIIILEGNGIHANGLTLARRIADKLPRGYLTPVPGDGECSYGEALLRPTPIYVPFVDACLGHHIPIHYAVNVTGHGWRKFMRSLDNLTYVIDTLPDAQPIFDFIAKHGPVTESEMYGNYNMGAGFALYVAPESVTETLVVLRGAATRSGQPVRAYHAGHVEAGPRRVVIEPRGLEFAGATLGVR